MRLIRKILLFIFDIIDERIHQKKIEKFIRRKKISLKTFIDVGAFRGKYTDLVFKIEENSKVIMIEPQGKYYSLLKDKYINNKQVEVIKVGLSDKKKKLTLKINKHEITSTFSNFNVNNKYLNYKALLFDSNLEKMTKNLEDVQVLPFSEILKEKNFDYIDLVKIDTEGHEEEVLNGLGEYIKKIKYILIEFHIDKIYENYDSNKINDFLIKNNFICLKKFNFPFTTWEDRLYKNSRFEN